MSARSRASWQTRGHLRPSAALYDRLLARWVHRRFYRAVASELESALPGGASILDVGTGPGRLLLELAQGRSDLRLVGVDPSEDMIRRGRDHARTAGLEDRIEFETVPAESLPFAAGTFDLVLSTLSAHHWADPTAAINEQVRVLRLGGQLRIDDLRREGLEGTDSGRGIGNGRHSATPGAAGRNHGITNRMPDGGQ